MVEELGEGSMVIGEKHYYVDTSICFEVMGKEKLMGKREDKARRIIWTNWCNINCGKVNVLFWMGDKLCKEIEFEKLNLLRENFLKIR